MNKRLFVGNLPYRVEENDLQSLFSQAGNVESVRVMRDMKTGRARGFGRKDDRSACRRPACPGPGRGLGAWRSQGD